MTSSAIIRYSELLLYISFVANLEFVTVSIHCPFYLLSLLFVPSTNPFDNGPARIHNSCKLLHKHFANCEPFKVKLLYSPLKVQRSFLQLRIVNHKDIFLWFSIISSPIQKAVYSCSWIYIGHFCSSSSFVSKLLL